jgi:hypothetical protein
MRSTVIGTAVITLCLHVAAACMPATHDQDQDAGVDGGGPSLENAAAVVGGEGGEVALQGGARVVLAAGSVASDVEIGVAQLADASVAESPQSTSSVGPAVAFTPHRQTFTVAVTIDVPYDATASDVMLVRLDDEADTTWEPIADASFSAGLASVQTTHFSIYRVVAREDADEQAHCLDVCADVQSTCGGEGTCADQCARLAAMCLPVGLSRFLTCTEDVLDEPTLECGSLSDCSNVEGCFNDEGSGSSGG